MRVVVLGRGHRHLLLPPVGLIDRFDGCLARDPDLFVVG
jgi:hypothetical protein